LSVIVLGVMGGVGSMSIIPMTMTVTITVTVPIGVDVDVRIRSIVVIIPVIRRRGREPRGRSVRVVPEHRGHTLHRLTLA
jgi:hypothetical protein